MKSDIRRRRIISALQAGFVGGGGSPVDPLSIWGANVKRWIDISKETGFIDDDLMSQITDFSGTGRHITASGANRGAYKTNQINGLPVFRAVGSQNYASINGKADDDFKHQGDFTIISIVKTNIDNATHTLFDSGATSAPNIGFTSQFSSTSGRHRTLIANGSGTYVVDLTLPLLAAGPSPTPKDVWLLIVQRYEQAKTIENFTVEVDNLLCGTYTKVGSNSASTSTSDPKHFNNVAGNAALNADVALIVELDIAATNAQLNEYLGFTLPIEG